MESLNDPYTNRGVAVWSPKDGNNNLIETITLYNKTIDGQGNPVSQDRINRQQEALDFIAAQNTTGANKTLYNTTYTQGTSPADPNAHLIMKLDNTANAGNGKLYTGQNEFKAASAHTKDSNTPATDVDELVEGMGVNDNSSGNNTFAFTYSGPGQVSGFSESGQKAWVTDFTYQPADFKK